MEQFLLASHPLQKKKIFPAFEGLPGARVQGGAGQMVRAHGGLPLALLVTWEGPPDLPPTPAIPTVSDHPALRWAMKEVIPGAQRWSQWVTGTCLSYLQ